MVHYAVNDVAFLFDSSMKGLLRIKDKELRSLC